MFNFSRTQIFLFCIKAMAVAALVWWFASYKAEHLKAPLSASAEMLQEPVQTATAQSAFELQEAGQSYQVQPVNEYELWGVVVATHDSAGWDDSAHAQWKDVLNTKDICVIWGANVQNPFLNSLKFSHGEWTCYVQTSSTEAWQKFKMNQLSNNHMIPGNPLVGDAIMQARIGDEVHFKGQLVNYGINHGHPRTTSTTREDTGNGACEIVYVNQFDILQRHNSIWYVLKQIGFWTVLASGAGAAISIFVLPFLE